jgi:glycosyltransferase involved in cell wall biosynthesis
MRPGDLSRAPWKVIFTGLKLLRVLLHLKPVVVHSYLPLATFVGSLAGRISRVPLVISAKRALGTHQDRHGFLRMLDLAANSLSHRVTVNSMAVKDDVISRDHLDPLRLVLIYNGIDTRPFEAASSMRERIREKMGVRPPEVVVTVIANLIPYKGHVDLLKAASMVEEEFPSVWFWLVGEDRGVLPDLEQMARRLGITSRVKFLGRRHDVPELLAASDLSVLPSHEEGFSNVILESMAAGCPVVATRVGGNPEAVLDGVTGWLVPPRSPEKLAVKMIDLLRDPEKAKRWGERARVRAKERFSLERMVEAHLRLYQQAVRPSPQIDAD